MAAPCALRHAHEHLHSVPDSALSPDFARAYDQVRLDVSAGGHGLRAWDEHAHAAYVGVFSFLWPRTFFGCICGTVVPQQVDLFVQIGRGDTEVGDAV